MLKCKKILSRSKPMLFLCLIVLSLSLLLPFCGILFAQNADSENRITQEDIDKMQAKLEQLSKEQEKLAAQLEIAKESANQNAALIISYEQLIVNYAGEIQSSEEIIASYSELIAQKTEELSQKQQEYSRMLRSYKDKLRFAHESGNFSYLQMILSSDNFSEFLAGIFRFGDILDHTNKIMQKLEESSAQIEQTLAELDHAKSEQQRNILSLAAKKDELAVKIQEAEEEKKNLDSNTTELEKLLLYYKDQEKNTDSALTELLKDYQSQIERDEAEKLLWPLDIHNNYVTSTFGDRIHPVHNRPGKHNGVDLAGKQGGWIAGDNIYASLYGKVIISGYGSGYGNYVVIDHGDGFTSVYAHCTKLLVQVGDIVERGDIVGIVGMTGTATGYHLHYELRQNGEKTDPLDYTYIFGGEYLPATEFVIYR
ncbi:MAG: hypothetical protein E7616_00155 [Ruminococcaceae bacterium]|nr:hypothetical protein [Oscillospiraceae bacterium]